MFEMRLNDLRSKLEDNGIDLALITNEDAVYYLTGYFDYLHMEFGRPTILVVPRDGKSLLITPSIDATMAQANARVDQIAAWNDGSGKEWRQELPAILENQDIAWLSFLVRQQTSRIDNSRSGQPVLDFGIANGVTAG